ncbi:unnamed protein product, partial [marine sediment metagenome]
IEENFEVLEKIDNSIVKLENKIMDKKTRVDIGELVKIKRELFTAGRRFWASTKILFLLKNEISELKPDRKITALFEDIHNTYLHQMDIVSSLKETLSGILSVYSTMLSNELAKTSNELNRVMKTLTTLTVLIMVPTFITGVYGMNFQYLPLAVQQNGFFVMLGIMGFSALILFLIFKKMKWI